MNSRPGHARGSKLARPVATGEDIDAFLTIRIDVAARDEHPLGAESAQRSRCGVHVAK